MTNSETQLNLRPSRNQFAFVSRPVMCRFLGRRDDGATAGVCTGVREGPRHEIAVGDANAVPRALWGFDGWAKFAEMDRQGCREWDCGSLPRMPGGIDGSKPFVETLTVR